MSAVARELRRTELRRTGRLGGRTTTALETLIVLERFGVEGKAPAPGLC